MGNVFKVKPVSEQMREGNFFDKNEGFWGSGVEYLLSTEEVLDLIRSTTKIKEEEKKGDTVTLNHWKDRTAVSWTRSL